MIISKEYGPQFDPSDGTVGECQLVIRYVLVCDPSPPLFSGGMIHPKQGRFTKATLEEALASIEEIKSNNPEDRIPKNLRAARCWCWPNHFDPLRLIDDEEEP